jgi:hypothetical protein
MKQKKFKVEEFYKNKWQPCMVNHKGKEIQKVVKITQDEADSNNRYKTEYKLRYVEDVEEVVDDSEKKTLVEEYIEVVGKKPFHGWDAETLKEKIEEEKLK